LISSHRISPCAGDGQRESPGLAPGGRSAGATRSVGRSRGKRPGPRPGHPNPINRQTGETLDWAYPERKPSLTPRASGWGLEPLERKGKFVIPLRLHLGLQRSLSRILVNDIDHRPAPLPALGVWMGLIDHDLVLSGKGAVVRSDGGEPEGSIFLNRPDSTLAQRLRGER